MQRTQNKDIIQDLIDLSRKTKKQLKKKPNKPRDQFIAS